MAICIFDINVLWLADVIGSDFCAAVQKSVWVRVQAHGQTVFGGCMDEHRASQL